MQLFLVLLGELDLAFLVHLVQLLLLLAMEGHFSNYHHIDDNSKGKHVARLSISLLWLL